jgi:DNA-binding response OmpR family regulator
VQSIFRQIKLILVEVVNNGEETLKAVHRELPGLILSDVMMPQMNGFQLLEAIRNDRATHKIPLILISARAGEEATLEGLASGADDYLVKPFSVRELVARVNTHLTMNQMRKEISEQQNKLMHSLKMSSLGEMAGSVAHEINNPLAIISLRISQLKELMQNDKFNQKIGIHWAEKIDAKVERIAKIIKGLRAFARDAEHDPF